jgi:hypothetical protein
MTVHAASQLAKHAARVDDVAGPADSAVASWMVPRNESPVIPTLPSDHGCLTAHSTTAAPVLGHHSRHRTLLFYRLLEGAGR